MPDSPIKAGDYPSGGAISLLRLLHLASPTLPIGAFAYSQGLEHAVERRWVHDDASAKNWIEDVMKNVLAATDVPLLRRLYESWVAEDMEEVHRWTAYLLACRESSEFRHEDLQLGAALMRLLNSLELRAARRWPDGADAAFLTSFTLAARHWRIGLTHTAMGFLWSWADNQVAAAIKLVPLGQTSGQRLLLGLTDAITTSVRTGLALQDNELGCSAPALAIASALHETQYSRMFRS